jgi:hypothetical protein
LKAKREATSGTRKAVASNLEADRRSTHTKVNAAGEHPNPQMQEGVNRAFFK